MQAIYLVQIVRLIFHANLKFAAENRIVVSIICGTAFPPEKMRSIEDSFLKTRSFTVDRAILIRIRALSNFGHTWHL